MDQKKQFRGRSGVEAFQRKMDRQTRNALGLPAAGRVPAHLRKAYQMEYKRQAEQERAKKLARKKARREEGQNAAPEPPKDSGP